MKFWTLISACAYVYVYVYLMYIHEVYDDANFIRLLIALTILGYSRMKIKLSTKRKYPKNYLTYQQKLFTKVKKKRTRETYMEHVCFYLLSTFNICIHWVTTLATKRVHIQKEWKHYKNQRSSTVVLWWTFIYFSFLSFYLKDISFTCPPTTFFSFITS